MKTTSQPTVEIQIAFSNLMGVNGDPYIKEIEETGQLTHNSYIEIVDNVAHNSLSSIFKYFGIIQWYYYQSDDYKSLQPKTNECPTCGRGDFD